MLSETHLEERIIGVSNTLLRGLVRLNGVSCLEGFLRLTQISMGELGWWMGLEGKGYSRQSINNWAKGRVPMCDEARKSFEALLYALPQERVLIKLRWHKRNTFAITLYRQCTCGADFKWTDARRKKCERCKR